MSVWEPKNEKMACVMTILWRQLQKRKFAQFWRQTPLCIASEISLFFVKKTNQTKKQTKTFAFTWKSLFETSV